MDSKSTSSNDEGMISPGDTSHSLVRGHTIYFMHDRFKKMYMGCSRFLHEGYVPNTHLGQHFKTSAKKSGTNVGVCTPSKVIATLQKTRLEKVKAA